MLYEALKKISIKQIIIVSTIIACVWMLMPVIIVVLNQTIVSFYTYNTWFAIFYFIGDVGVLLGTTYLFKLYLHLSGSTKEKLISLIPILAILLFGIWCFVCTEHASMKFIAYLGYFTALDNLTAYFSYLGYIFIGLIIANDKKKLLFISNAFVLVSFIMAVLSIIDNDFTAKLFVNAITNKFHYQGVFYNTNHYGYYLTIVCLLTGFSFVYAKKNIYKAINLVAFVVNLYLLILNDTLGSYLGVMFAIACKIVWSFINKEDNKKHLFVLAGVFVLVSALSVLVVPNVVNNFTGLYSTLFLTNVENPQATNEVGSGRGLLWKYALLVSTQNPIFGIGPQNASSSAHNLFLQLSVNTGFVGLVLYLLIYLISAKRLFKAKKELTTFQSVAAFIMIGYLVSGFFGVTMFYTAPYYYVVLGIALSGTLKNITIWEETSNEKIEQ